MNDMRRWIDIIENAANYELPEDDIDILKNLELRKQISITYTAEEIADDEKFEELCFKKIGEGLDREVFIHNKDKSKVIKREKTYNNPNCTSRSHPIQNTIEYAMWNKFKDHPVLGEWLAPCHDISLTGNYLIMTRAKKVRSYRELPMKIPAVFDAIDNHAANWGYVNDRLVCIDYGDTNSYYNTDDKRDYRKSFIKRSQQDNAFEMRPSSIRKTGL